VLKLPLWYKIVFDLQVRASYLQIYNESISDLLRPDHH